MKKSLILIGVVLVAVLLTIACDDDTPGDGTVDPPQVPAPVDPIPPELPEESEGGGVFDEDSCTSASRVSWADAWSYLGQKVALFGPVTDVRSGTFAGESGTTLLVGYQPGDEDLVEIFIPDRLAEEFPDPATYEGEVVCVFGVIAPAGANVAIVVNEPEELQVL